MAEETTEIAKTERFANTVENDSQNPFIKASHGRNVQNEDSFSQTLKPFRSPSFQSVRSSSTKFKKNKRGELSIPTSKGPLLNKETLTKFALAGQKSSKLFKMSHREP